MSFVAKIRILAFMFLFVASLASSAEAEGVAKFEVDFFEHGSSQAMNQATVWVSGRRVRVEQARPGGAPSGPVLIYRGDEGRLLSVHPRSKIYSEVAQQRLAGLEREIKLARLAIDRQLGSLPSDQRKAFERLLGLTRPDPGMVDAPVIVRRDDVVEQVSGFECGRVTLTRGDVVVGQACIVPWQKIGLSEHDMQVFRQLGNFKREAIGARGLTPMELIPDQPLDLLVQFDGFPMYYRRSVDGRPRSAIAVRSVERPADDDTLFEVPTDYALRGGAGAFLGHFGLGGAPASPGQP